MSEAPRISVRDAHERVSPDGDALLVCAYDGDEKFEKNHLAEAISLAEFESRSDDVDPEREIIFYCA